MPAKSFEISKRFYLDLGFQPRQLTDNLVEMRLGAYAFILQGHYIVSLDLSSRYKLR